MLKTEAIELLLSKELFAETDDIKKSITEKSGPKNCSIVSARSFIKDKSTRTLLRSFLDSVVHSGYTATYVRGSSEGSKAFKDLLRFYITPRIYLKADTQKDPPVQSLSTSQFATIDHYVTKL
jgi:hypothetical protein